MHNNTTAILVPIEYTNYLKLFFEFNEVLILILVLNLVGPDPPAGDSLPPEA